MSSCSWLIEALPLESCNQCMVLAGAVSKIGARKLVRAPGSRCEKTWVRRNTISKRTRITGVYKKVIGLRPQLKTRKQERQQEKEGEVAGPRKRRLQHEHWASAIQASKPVSARGDEVGRIQPRGGSVAPRDVIGASGQRAATRGRQG